MKRIMILSILTAISLAAIPSTAQARYRDGMNLYEYVRSDPVGKRDPQGTAVMPMPPFEPQPTSPVQQPASPDSRPPAPDSRSVSPYPVPELYPGLDPSGIPVTLKEHLRMAEKINYNLLSDYDKRLYLHRKFERTKGPLNSFSTEVRYGGRIVGVLRFTLADHYEIEKDKWTGKFTMKAGAQIRGGFHAWVDLQKSKPCCNELRWTQVYDEESLPMNVKNMDRVDGYENWRTRSRGAPPVSPFYYRDGRPGENSSDPAALNYVDPDTYHAKNIKPLKRNGSSATLFFHDTPGDQESYWPSKFRAKLCLMCVKGENRAFPLRCVTYGFDVAEGDKLFRVKLHGLSATEDTSLPPVGRWTLK
jgi:hypothetical protein